MNIHHHHGYSNWVGASVSDLILFWMRRTSTKSLILLMLRKKNRKRFLKIQPKKRTIVSPVVGFCSQMFSLQIIPIFLCLHSYTNKNHPLKSSKQPYNCGSGLFLGGGAGGACRGACFPCVCVHTGMEKLLNTTDLASDTLIQNPV